MSRVQRFDHVGVTVDDLEAVTSFFLKLGLEQEGSRRSWRATGWIRSSASTTSGSKWSCCKHPAAAPGWSSASSTSPSTNEDRRLRKANEFGLRNIAFEVDDIQATVDRLRADGFELVGGIGVYEDIYRLCYVRGPEGIIVSLAERIT